jgi:Leucine-rich repeat (LRR) protein
MMFKSIFFISVLGTCLVGLPQTAFATEVLEERPLKQRKTNHIETIILPKNSQAELPPEIWERILAQSKNKCSIRLVSKTWRSLLNKTIQRFEPKKLRKPQPDIIKDFVRFMGELPNLTVLILKMSYIGDAGVASLANGNLSALTSLNLRANNISSKGVAYLVNGKLSALTDLSLEYNEIDDMGAASLANSKLPALTSLNLQDNNIGPRGAACFANGKLSALADLDLENNKIGDGLCSGEYEYPFD